MKALLIQVDYNTGKRPPVILDARGKIKENLWCGHKWKNIDKGIEIRAVKDGNVTPYEEQSDIIVLNNEVEIRAALAENCPDEIVHTVSNEAIMSASIARADLDFEDLPQEATQEEELAYLYDKGIKGITRQDMCPQCPLEICGESHP